MQNGKLVYKSKLAQNVSNQKYSETSLHHRRLSNLLTFNNYVATSLIRPFSLLLRPVLLEVCYCKYFS